MEYPQLHDVSRQKSKSDDPRNEPPAVEQLTRKNAWMTISSPSKGWYNSQGLCETLWNWEVITILLGGWTKLFFEEY